MSQAYRVLIADSMSAAAADILGAVPGVTVHNRAGIPADELLEVIGDYHGLLVRSRTKVTAEVIARADALRIIGRAGIGVDNIDLDAASRRGVVVENAPSGNAVTTAEHAICLLCALARNIPQGTASMKAGRWDKKKLSGRELMGKTLGVVGLGNIGRITAVRAAGLRMKVIASDPYIGAEAAGRLGVELVTFGQLLERADFITLHIPLTGETRGIIGADALAKVKPGVLLVNASRGGVVDEAALLDALEAGRVGGAALDVFEAEPPPADHPLVAHPRVICTPHLGASTAEAQHKVAAEVAEQLAAYFGAGEIRNAVNTVAVPAEIRESLAPWLDLAQKLGVFVAQLLRTSGGQGFCDELEVELTGEPAELGATACTRATLVGLLDSFTDASVNEINASLIARERGLTVCETKASRHRDFAAALTVTARTGDAATQVVGTLFHVGGRVEPRLVQIDEFLVEAAPDGYILIVRNEDRPRCHRRGRHAAGRARHQRRKHAARQGPHHRRGAGAVERRHPGAARAARRDPGAAAGRVRAGDRAVDPPARRPASRTRHRAPPTCRYIMRGGRTVWPNVQNLVSALVRGHGRCLSSQAFSTRPERGILADFRTYRSDSHVATLFSI